LALSGANLLLLDEPTNHLDIDSQEIFQAVIEEYGGTVLMVSHDRALIDALATQIWAITPEQRMEIYKGSFQAYMRDRRQQREAAQAASNGGSSKRGQPAQYKEKVRGMNPYQLKQRVDQLEDNIADLETQLDTLMTRIEAASAQGDSAQVQELGKTYAKTKQALEVAMEEWAELAEHVD
jgi:ATP-binding cassette subfamily F protein 3